ncbi:plasmid mobilization protein [Dyadobacter psychrotolerans]|uniref:Plasmid mobilization relaxosome protein MobC n=1 Tax=Dyadobacter psychrotolerans TaxID=2541721 RepID=A0A4R5DRC3_9BACT|nr:plasmid mobilization relaxosome protein MobC [Dyadobacter psychrotolerans]TDE14770.1 plasmid mobilization relaxosome protein MobC [Dyadobacter psychrotolerans]
MGNQKSNKTRIVALRLSAQEFTLLDRKFKGSTCHKLSEYIRKVILEKPVVVNYRNGSLDDSVKELIRLRNELNNIGNNFNQAVKKLHTLDQISEFKSWIITYELDKRRLLLQIDEIKKQINKTADQWLQS